MYIRKSTRTQVVSEVILPSLLHGRHLSQLLAVLIFSITNALPSYAQSGNSACGSLMNAYGPYDYRTDIDKLPIVLANHFTSEVEALIRGKTGERPGADIDYTLRAIPNNHRALMAMMRLGEKEKTVQPNGSRYTVECWFERAILFRPDDAIVRMIYSTYLNSIEHTSEANEQLDIATKYAQDNAFTHYNIGLHYFDLKNYDKALRQAHKAISLGFPQTALRDQLQRVGKWAEIEDSPSRPASAPVQ